MDELTLEAMKEARESLDWEADNNMERLATCLVILARGFLDTGIRQMEEEPIPEEYRR